MAVDAKTFRIIVATDGSNNARVAVTTALHFPWPAETRVRVVVARRSPVEYRRSILLTALDRSAEIAADHAKRVLTPRWPGLDVTIVDKSPVTAVLAEADRFKADVIVVGWRGHGAVRRALMGSVSRGIVRGAACSVLVVRGRQRVHRIVVGLDQTPHTSRALAFVERLVPPARGRVTLATAMTLTPVPSRRIAVAVRDLAREVKRSNTMRARVASRELNRAAARLKERGWETRTALTTGEPLNDLLAAVKAARADLLVVGAKGTSRVRHLLLGSVAEGALNRSPVPVLLAR
jgi:nucleotide-binding universal stress UspA family protein